MDENSDVISHLCLTGKKSVKDACWVAVRPKRWTSYLKNDPAIKLVWKLENSVLPIAELEKWLNDFDKHKAKTLVILTRKGEREFILYYSKNDTLTAKFDAQEELQARPNVWFTKQQLFRCLEKLKTGKIHYEEGNSRFWIRPPNKNA